MADWCIFSLCKGKTKASEIGRSRTRPRPAAPGAHRGIWVLSYAFGFNAEQACICKRVSCLTRWLVNCLSTNLARLFIHPLESIKLTKTNLFQSVPWLHFPSKGDVCDGACVILEWSLEWGYCDGVKQEFQALSCLEELCWMLWKHDKDDQSHFYHGPSITLPWGREMCLLMLCSNTFKRRQTRHFPESSVVKTSHSKAVDVGYSPGWKAEI